MLESIFCERKFPNQGTGMGPEIAPRSPRCAPPRQNERAGLNHGGSRGKAPAFFFRLSPEAGLARSRAGTHVAGSNLQRSQKGPPADPAAPHPLESERRIPP